MEVAVRQGMHLDVAVFLRRTDGKIAVYGKESRQSPDDHFGQDTFPIHVTLAWEAVPYDLIAFLPKD
jgi:hypothetical protein